MLTKKAATAVNYFEYFSPTPHAVHYSAHCSEETEDRRRRCQEDRQKYRAAFDRQQPHKKHKSNNNNEREYKTCWKHKYWQHTRMLPQTVKLFRFMNINAHPAKGGGVGCGSSAGRGWRGGAEEPPQKGSLGIQNTASPSSCSFSYTPSMEPYLLLLFLLSSS